MSYAAKKFFRKPFRSDAQKVNLRPNADYSELAPWKANTSEALMATFDGRYVTAYPDESPDSLLRRFKRQVESSGVLAELKKREYYLSPSQKARQKKQAAIKKAKKEASERKRFVE